ncbi:MAG: DNA photolyase family protein [Microscillaceae bacterium]|jgi:deoxyribodipyrimidine photo-lyase|nr:DNA photolyase family protein [Microscillaceae bacterium]
MDKISIFWFRRDLRLQDNAGLYQALRAGKPVLPIFIFDRDILDKLSDKQDKRVNFIYQTIQNLRAELQNLGSTLLVKYGKPEQVWQDLLVQLPIAQVFANHDYEPYANRRDAQIKTLLQAQSIDFQTFKDQCIFEKSEVLTDAGKPYTVFTPYSRKWKAQLSDFYLQSYSTEKHFNQLISNAHSCWQSLDNQLISLQAMGFEPSHSLFPPQDIRTDIIQKYTEQRDFPALDSTTRLSVHLRFGTVSIRKLTQLAVQLNPTWLNELIWRDFYMMILHHFQRVENQSFKPEYDKIEWRNNPTEFEAWCEGKTGYPIVDAGMRELNQTGFMHNRVRMITASFLTKHLLIDWRWGEQYFAHKLLDYDMAANNGGWQWAAGSGCDAAPYFRIFNPYTQTQKFDSQLKYIKKWIPELNTLHYPQPIVAHEWARKRCLETYQKALKNSSL